MSEYQYYEFQTLDRPLTQAEMAELRRYSSRARITPMSFVNEYSWGNFKGNRREWMEKYFDAFLYVANWGSHWLELRVSKRLLDPEIVAAYCAPEALCCRTKGEYVMVLFVSEDEDGGWEEGEDWLASLAPLRSGLINGDRRALYLGWLVAVQAGEIDEEEVEPPVPPGLGSLDAPLRSLVDFLRVDDDLLGAAAENSASEQCSALSWEAIMDWVAKLSLNEKDSVISELIEGKDPHFASELRQRAIREIQRIPDRGDDGGNKKQRTVGQLVLRAQAMAKERQTKEAEIRAREKAKREREEAERRKKYLEAIAGKEEEIWLKVGKLIASKNPKRYDDAVSLLQDLRDVAGMTGQTSEFSSRMESLCHEHSRKSALLERFRKAGLSG